MDGFVGREDELNQLEQLYRRTPGSCAISGRRHVGKTQLISKFCEGKKTIYISGMKGLRSDNERQIREELRLFAGRDVILDDMINLFRVIEGICGNDKVVVVIDRYSDLKDNFPSMEDALREFMSRRLNNTKILLIVCDDDSSLLNMIFTNIEVKKMNYLECSALHPDYNARQNLMVYSIVGGVPVYHAQFEGDPTDIIRTKMFDHLSFFALEAECFFSDDDRGKSQFKVMAALASGAYSPKVISDRSGVSLTNANKILDDLHNRGLLIKENAGRLKSSNYYIGSFLLKFYFEVVNKYTSLAEYRGIEYAYKLAASDIVHYLERTFKEVCIEHLDINYDVRRVTRMKPSEEVTDFMMDMVKDNVVRTVYAKCRLEGQPMNRKDLENLKNYGKVHSGSNRMYFMFSGCGFSEDLVEAVSNDLRVKLIGLDDMYA